MSNTAADVVTIENHGDVAAIPRYAGMVLASAGSSRTGGRHVLEHSLFGGALATED